MEHKIATETIDSQQRTIELLASKAAGFDDINEQYDKVTQHAYDALRIFAPNERPHSPYDAIDALVALLRRKDNAIAYFAKDALLREMQGISEDEYFCGWYGELEYALWEPHLNPCGAESTERLKELAGLAGGWWVWRDKRHAFVSLEEWEEMRKDR